MKDSVDREEYLFDCGQRICSCKGDGRGKTIFESCTKECQEIGRGKATSRRMGTGGIIPPLEKVRLHPLGYLKISLMNPRVKSLA
ncbi:hypothetical protein CEXT_123271 [Caerostris extrusa]|uniref:Uncharacterized protein n=1 Tax=Caerostris extrusa TaxID=172846 RepID=A0AAV4XYJ6_CAEEX|nr:hypothetical protein CEXT_123271 [Caerostris extrusa]